jgi:hypothetical protein
LFAFSIIIVIVTIISGLSESAEGAVIKLDCNKRIFEDVLKYIYTGQVSFSGTTSLSSSVICCDVAN